jgi:hypothetical protein
MALPGIYIVRIHRRRNSVPVVGSVEVVRSGATFRFRNALGLWAALTRRRVPRR